MLPWPSFLLMTVPPVVLFVVALVYWLGGPKDERAVEEPE
jgi:hypothetical protein